MGQAKVIFIILAMILGFGVTIHFFTAAIAPPDSDPTFATVDISRPRAPSKARRIVNPISPSDTVIKKGDELYHVKGSCNVCHGEEGRGDGDGGTLLSPKPRDLTDPSFHMLRTDGEMFWSIKHGVEGTGMFSYTPRMITEEEAWMVIHYIRTLRREES